MILAILALLSLARAQDAQWPEAVSAIEAALQAEDAEAQAQIFGQLAGPEADPGRQAAVAAASQVARILARAPTADPQLQRDLFTAALLGTEQQRIDAITKAMAQHPRPLGAGPGPGRGGLGGGPPAGAGPGASTLTLTPERLNALRKYRSQSLVIRRETDISGGGVHATTFGGYVAPYPAGYGYYYPSTTMVVSDPVRTTRTWGVYRGPQRLTVPEFLTVTGESDAAGRLTADIEKSRKRAKVWFVGAGVGAAGLVAGIVGNRAAVDADGRYTWDVVSMVSGGVAVGGLICGSFPSTRASRLLSEPGQTLTSAQAQELVDQHNEALRKELELSPDEVWLMELGAGGSDGR